MNIEAEIKWKRSLPKFDFKFLKETFPEAKDIYIEKLEQAINEAKIEMAKSESDQRKIDEYILMKVPKEDEDLVHTISYGLFVDGIKEKCEKIIKRNQAHINALRGKRKPKGGVSDAEIAQAKEYPIEDLLDFRRNITTCLWHNEKTGSLHYYAFDNHVHCFGCGKSADAIDVYRQLNSVDFISAVKALQ